MYVVPGVRKTCTGAHGIAHLTSVMCTVRYSTGTVHFIVRHIPGKKNYVCRIYFQGAPVRTTTRTVRTPQNIRKPGCAHSTSRPRHKNFGIINPQLKLELTPFQDRQQQPSSNSNMSWFSSLAGKVQSVLPPNSNDILNALTLNTAEMTAEREQMELEECRKDSVKDALSALLPWETNDEERAILVEECRGEILLLSTREETFLGKNACEGSATAGLNASESASDLLRRELASRQRIAGSTSADLPPLLENFDLDAHVGFIRRMFDADPNLVEMHAKLSGKSRRPWFKLLAIIVSRLFRHSCL